MAFLRDDQTLQAVSDALSQANIEQVPNQVVGTNQRAHAWAEAYVVAQLGARGYTPAQIAAWDLGASFVYVLSSWYALAMSRAIQSLGATGTMLLTQFDWRKELQTIPVTAGGQFQAPVGTDAVPACGDMDTSTDIFVLPPSGTDDFPGPGRGEPTVF